MLTNLYYYNHYKPFILDTKQNKKESSLLKNKSSYTIYKNSNYKEKEISFFLNKALNDNVKAYMFELAANFNGIKNISLDISEKLASKVYTEPLEEEIEVFSANYNKFTGFLEENSENGKNFEKILKNIKDKVLKNIDLLEKLGIKALENGFLQKTEETLIKKSNIDKNKIVDFFKEIYKNLCEFMKEPMSEYMEFKDFSYYFNYAGDYDKNKSFRIIERGILVDIAL